MYVCDVLTRVTAHTTSVVTSARGGGSDGCAALEVLLDVAGVLAVEALQLFVELHVPLVDVVDVGVGVEGAAPAVLGALADPATRHTNIASVGPHNTSHQNRTGRPTQHVTP